jgi:oxygen-independent coproporphyrinogen-3 oxidase
MYGLPTSSVESVERTLTGLVSLEPDHLSCYALTLEPETPMGAQAEEGSLVLLGDDAVADQYGAIQAGLATAGFQQYELSNWARPGCASRHNLTYWRNGEWLGLGAGASGSIAGLRYKRTPIVRDYIAAAAAGQSGFVFEEPSTREALMHDTVMLGLRLAEGVSNTTFTARFGVSLEQYCGPRLGELTQAGVLVWRDDALTISPSHYFICNAVLGELLPAPGE